MSTATILIGCALASLNAVGKKAVDLQAEAWFNPSSIRVPDDRTYVLFFFMTFQKDDPGRWIAMLNKLHRRRDVVVVGLSPESKERVEKFIKKRKVRFTIGAQSRAYKDFKIKRFPQLVILQSGARGEQSRWTVPDTASLSEWFPDVPLDEPLESGAFNEKSAVELLKRHAREDADYSEQKRAVKLLREKLPPEEFMDFCDEILAYEYRPALRGAISYQKHLADPNAPVKEPLLAPSVRASHSFKKNANDPKWNPYHDYFSQIDDRTSEQLVQDFYDHRTDDPIDLLIRRGLPYELVKRPDKENVRSSLMQILLDEPDSAVRQRIVGALSEVCGPGDFEAADFLDTQLKTETNIRVVRPMMEYVIRYLRTGEE